MTALTATPNWMEVEVIPVDLRDEISEQIARLRKTIPKLVKQTNELYELADRYSAAMDDVPENVRDHFDVTTGFNELDELVGLIGIMFSLDDSTPTDPVNVIAKRLGVEALWA